MAFIKQYVVTFIMFFIIDIVWLGFIAKKLYRDNLSFIMAGKINWPVAIIFYSIFIIRLVLFAISPALEKDSLIHALKMGALFGFATYFTYDMNKDRSYRFKTEFRRRRTGCIKSSGRSSIGKNF